MNIILCEISSTWAALLGAFIGGIFGIIGTVIITWSSFKTQKKSFQRNAGQQKINDTKSAYQSILKVIYLLRMEGFINQNRTLHAEMVSQVSIFGSDELKEKHLLTLRDGLPDDVGLNSIIALMGQHINQLESQLTN